MKRNDSFHGIYETTITVHATVAYHYTAGQRDSGPMVPHEDAQPEEPPTVDITGIYVEGHELHPDTIDENMADLETEIIERVESGDMD